MVLLGFMCVLYMFAISASFTACALALPAFFELMPTCSASASAREIPGSFAMREALGRGSRRTQGRDERDGPVVMPLRA
jgi:hypothetical protein